MKKVCNMLVLFTTVLLVMSTGALGFPGYAMNNNTSGAANITGSPTSTITSEPNVTETGILPDITETAVPVGITETVIPETTLVEQTEEVQEETPAAPTATPTPKAPGFEIVGAIIVISAIYIIGKRR